jgi:hypothetical protein
VMIHHSTNSSPSSFLHPNKTPGIRKVMAWATVFCDQMSSRGLAGTKPGGHYEFWMLASGLVLKRRRVPSSSCYGLIAPTRIAFPITGELNRKAPVFNNSKTVLTHRLITHTITIILREPTGRRHVGIFGMNWCRELWKYLSPPFTQVVSARGNQGNSADRTSYRSDLSRAR